MISLASRVVWNADTTNHTRTMTTHRASHPHVSPGRSALTALAVTIAALATPAYAQFEITTGVGSAPTQTFDSLITSGTNQAWTNDVTVGAGSETLNGWSLFSGTTPPGALTTYSAGSGTTTAGGFFSFGSGTATDRSLGGLGSGGAYFGNPGNGAVAGYIAFAATNNSGVNLASFTVGFDGEQWRNNGNANAHTMVFEFGFGATFDAVASWTAPGGNFDWVSPVVGGSAAPLDGNAAGLVAGRGGTTIGQTWGNGDTLWLRWIERNDTGTDHSLAIDNFTFSWQAGTAPKILTWAASSSTWDTAAVNWQDQTPAASAFTTGDAVNFTDTGLTQSTVAIAAGGVTPGSVNVSNSSGTYTFGGGPINGGAALTKTNAGTLALTADNGFTGPVNILGGTVVIGAGTHLGPGINAVQLDNDSALQAAAAVTSNHPLTVNSGGGTIALGGNSFTQMGTATLNGLLRVTGGGNLALNGTASFGTTGALEIAAGSSLTLAQGSGVVTMGSGGVFNGDLIINSTARLNLNNFGQTYGGTGKIKILGTALGAGSGGMTLPTNGNGFANFNALLTNSFNSTGGSITSDIELNPAGTGHVAFTPGNITTPAYTTASFLAFLGADGTGTLEVTGKITGEGDVFFASNSVIGGGGGTLVLNAQSTYAGNTLIDNAGTIRLGTDNALPIGTHVMVGNINSATPVNRFSILDLNGFDQQIASLSSGAQGAFANLSITNGSTDANAVLIISGSTTPANAFLGTISDGIVSKTTVVKGGTNTLTLAGPQSFATLEITGGTVNLDDALDSALLAEGSTVNVATAPASTGTLNIGASQTLAALNIGAGGVVTLVAEAPAPAGEGLGEVPPVAVPEPAGAALLACGALGLLGRRRQRRT